MNKLVQSMMAVVFSMLVLTGTASSQDNLLLKDDFEKGTQAMPDGWQTGAQIQGVKYVYDKSNAKSGERSLSLKKSANRYFPIAQWFRVMKHKSELGSLKVTSQVRAEKATKAKLDVMFLDSDGEQLKHSWVANIGSNEGGPATHDWKEYSGVVSIPKRTKEIVFGLQIYGPGMVWFDDLEAIYVEAPEKVKDEDEVAAKPKLENKVEINVGKSVGHYLSVPARTKQEPANGHGLLIVLPGGDGSADFHPFVSNIHANALGDDFVLAQPLARKWTDDQYVVWPIAKLKVKKMEYTTEQLIAAVIEDVGKKTKIDPKRIYLLGWSSGGPAVYATLLNRNSPVAGGIAAMSVYKPKIFPKPAGAKGRSIYILHSPDDRVCPYWMAKSGHDELENAKVRTKLVDYAGGHGWRGDVFGNIKSGIQWLEEAPDTDD